MIVVPRKSCFISKSIDTAFKLFPYSYRNRQNYYHFAFMFEKSKLLAIGQNNMRTENSKALKFAKRFKVDDKFKYLHAETDLIGKLWGKVYIEPHFKMVVLRLNSLGEIQNSKPCKNCTQIIEALNIKRVYYSTSKGEIESW